MAIYERKRYWTTHNSYEGGARNWIPAQLDGNVRCVELDIWDNDYKKFGDFRLGHLKPGHAVARGTGAAGENPTTLLLRDWLKVITDWSDSNDHAVITLVLDVKSDLTDNDDAGDLEDLNQKLEKAFAESLFTRDDYDVAGGWPESPNLRNKVMCVLSGNSNNRASYRYCFGEKPAIALDADGNVVLACRSSAGDMRYWSGKAKLPARGQPGGVVWRHKGTYAWNSYSVSEPSVAMMADGWVVSVHRIGPAPGKPGPALLEYTVGELRDDGRIDWHGGRGFGSGLLPSLEFAGGNKVRLIHTTDSGKSLRLREGTLNRKKARVEWGKAAATDGPAFPRDTAAWKSHSLRCLTNATGMILCAFDGAQKAVGYRQVAFVELQSEEGSADFVDPLFYGTSASNPAAIARARNLGRVARAWWFKQGNETSPPSPPQENFAATDHPFDPSYAPYMAAGGQTEV
jgi:hypothetical protein